MDQMSEGFGILINPTDPSKYGRVMEIVGPHLPPGRVNTKESSGWRFGDWSDRDDRDMIVRILLQAGIRHKTIYLTEQGSSGSPHRLVL